MPLYSLILIQPRSRFSRLTICRPCHAHVFVRSIDLDLDLDLDYNMCCRESQECLRHNLDLDWLSLDIKLDSRIDQKSLVGSNWFKNSFFGGNGWINT